MNSPMLAAQKPPALSTLQYPIIVQPKLDGVRARMDSLAFDRLFSRTGKLIPNRTIQMRYSSDLPYSSHLLDGELVWPGHSYNETQSVVMSDEHPASHEIEWHIFDVIASFVRQDVRIMEVFKTLETKFRKRVPTRLVRDRAELDQEIDRWKDTEGLILRRPDGLYKYGRTTLRERLLLKIVSWVREEARVVGYDPLICQGNYTRETLGSLRLSSPRYNTEFGCGSGFTDADRLEIWNNPANYMGRTVVFKHKPFGALTSPRQAIFVGWRNTEID